MSIQFAIPSRRSGAGPPKRVSTPKQGVYVHLQSGALLPKEAVPNERGPWTWNANDGGSLFAAKSSVTARVPWKFAAPFSRSFAIEFLPFNS